MPGQYTKRAPRIARICLECGGAFTVTVAKSRRKPAKYCGKVCASKGNAKAASVRSAQMRARRVCDACGQEFAVPQWVTKARPATTCSLACAYQLRAGRYKSVITRLLAKRVITDAGCWEWTGSRAPAGYGAMSFHGKRTLVSRVSAAVFLGFSLDAALFVCHHCDNPPCFNPAHLFIGTAADNTQDRISKGRPGPADALRGKRSPKTQGSRHVNAKLSEADIPEIRALLANGLPQTRIAARFEVSSTTINHIAHGKAWTHVE